MKALKRSICSITALVLVMSAATAAGRTAEYSSGTAAPPTLFSASGPAAVTDKDEVVYARLSASGGAQNIYVVNHFSLSSGGNITDYGDYTAVINLTGLEPITLENGTVTVPSDSENFYYQGNLSGSNLPWLYEVEYRLDGVLTPPESLGGKSGSLEIRMTSAQNTSVNAVFYNNYMQQITLTLNNDDCANIRAPGATTANAGKNRILVYTVLPGQDARITISADVKDFEMGGLEITAMPFSMSFEIPATDDMIDDFTLLTGAIAELSDGVGKLNDGAAAMASGSAELKDGSSEFLDGLSQLNANAGQLAGGSSQIMEALSLIASSLSNADISSDMLAELARLPELLTQLADGLNQVTEGLTAQKETYTQAFSALDRAIAGIPSHQVTRAQLENLYEKADDDEKALLDRLMESFAAAAAVSDAYGQNKQALSSVGASLDSLSRSNIPAMLSLITSQISGALSGNDMNDMIGQLGQLTDGLLELSMNYAGFHGGLSSFMQGLSALYSGYAELDGGISELSGGIAEMSGGIAVLHDGTNQLAAETSGMPELIKNEIENLVSEYSSAEFEAVSFTSDKNTDISFVQFVFRAEGIAKPAAESGGLAEADQLTFWDRLKRLFQ